MLQNVAVYPMEKDVFYRENDDGTYGVEAFLAQYITLEVPFEIGTSLVFAVLTDLAAGLPRGRRRCSLCAFLIASVLSIQGRVWGSWFASLSFSPQSDQLTEKVQHPLRPHRLRRQLNLRLPLRRPDHVWRNVHQHARLPQRRQLSVSPALRDPQPRSLLPLPSYVHVR
jgi:hypothetical protein